MNVKYGSAFMAYLPDEALRKTSDGEATAFPFFGATTSFSFRFKNPALNFVEKHLPLPLVLFTDRIRFSFYAVEPGFYAVEYSLVLADGKIRAVEVVKKCSPCIILGHEKDIGKY